MCIMYFGPKPEKNSLLRGKKVRNKNQIAKQKLSLNPFHYTSRWFVSRVAGELGTLSKDHNENTMPTRVKMIPFCKDPYPKKIHFIWVAMYKRTNWGLYFYISNLNRDRHFRWSSKPCEGLAICSEKGVPSFLSYSLDGFGNRTHDLPLCSFSFWILSYIL